MYWCNVTNKVHKTDIITFLHPCERLVVQKVLVFVVAPCVMEYIYILFTHQLMHFY